MSNLPDARTVAAALNSHPLLAGLTAPKLHPTWCDVQRCRVQVGEYGTLGVHRSRIHNLRHRDTEVYLECGPAPDAQTVLVIEPGEPDPNKSPLWRLPTPDARLLRDLLNVLLPGDAGDVR